MPAPARPAPALFPAVFPALLLALACAGLTPARAQPAPPATASATWQPPAPGDVQRRLSPEALARPATQGGTYPQTLSTLAQHGWLGHAPADADPLVQAFGQATPDTGLAVRDRLTAAVRGATLLQAHAAARAQALADAALTQDLARSLAPDPRPAEAAPPPATALRVRQRRWETLARELGQVAAALQALHAETRPQHVQQQLDTLMPVARWEAVRDGPEYTHPLPDEATGVARTLLSPLGCPPAPAPCPEFEERVDLVRVFNLGQRLRGYLSAGGLARQLADANLQDARWETYRTQARHQYVWELWINGRLMPAQLCAQDPGTGLPRGFCAVPSHQWVLLHPEAALTYNRKARNSQELGAALLVDLVGYHRWTWADPGAQMRKRWGVSLAAAWTDHGDGRRWGLGPAVTLGSGYHLALTRAPGGRYSLLVNLRLADRYFGRPQAAVAYLRQPDKRGAALP